MQKYISPEIIDVEKKVRINENGAQNIYFPRTAMCAEIVGSAVCSFFDARNGDDKLMELEFGNNASPPFKRWMGAVVVGTVSLLASAGMAKVMPHIDVTQYPNPLDFNVRLLTGRG